MVYIIILCVNMQNNKTIKAFCDDESPTLIKYWFCSIIIYLHTCIIIRVYTGIYLTVWLIYALILHFYVLSRKNTKEKRL